MSENGNHSPTQLTFPDWMEMDLPMFTWLSLQNEQLEIHMIKDVDLSNMSQCGLAETHQSPVII